MSHLFASAALLGFGAKAWFEWKRLHPPEPALDTDVRRVTRAAVNALALVAAFAGFWAVTWISMPAVAESPFAEYFVGSTVAALVYRRSKSIGEFGPFISFLTFLALLLVLSLLVLNVLI